MNDTKKELQENILNAHVVGKEDLIKTRYEKQKEHQDKQHQELSNHEIIESWLHGKSERTKIIYLTDVKRFLHLFDNRHIGWITANDLHKFADILGQVYESLPTRSRIISVVKSLFSHAHSIGAIPSNVGGQLKIPKQADTLNERILTHQEVMKLLINAEEDNIRDYVIIRLLYVTGIRVSELVGMDWKHIREKDDHGLITVTGKGNKTRSILIDKGTLNHLYLLKGNSSDDAPVFMSQKGNRLHVTSVWRMIKKYGKKAGIQGDVSPHWLRHAHASHSLDNGSPVHVVQSTLGHSNVATTSRYLHANPEQSSSKFIKI